MRFISRVRSALAALRLRQFALAAARCPFCGPSLFVRLNGSDSGVRCVRCAASSVHLLLGEALRRQVPDLARCAVCELSASGPHVDHLRRCAGSLSTSEYREDAAPGSVRAGIRCEDVQRLTYRDASFDVVTHTEVMEHVPDDARAFAELRRVLRPGGVMLFTVPLHGGERTVERARLRDGRIEHLQEPVYHLDPLRRAGILAWRDYGSDIIERVRAAGFDDVRLMVVPPTVRWLPPRAVVVARVAA